MLTAWSSLMYCPESSFRFRTASCWSWNCSRSFCSFAWAARYVGLDAADGLRDLAREAPLRALELRVDLLHLRAARDEDLGLLGVAHLELAHLLLEPLDERIGEHARQRIARAILHQSVLRLGGDARRLGVGHAPSEIGQPLARSRSRDRRARRRRAARRKSLRARSASASSRSTRAISFWRKSRASPVSWNFDSRLWRMKPRACALATRCESPGLGLVKLTSMRREFVIGFTSSQWPYRPDQAGRNAVVDRSLLRGGSGVPARHPCARARGVRSGLSRNRHARLRTALTTHQPLSVPGEGPARARVRARG